MIQRMISALALAALTLAASGAQAAEPAANIAFERKQLDSKFRSEGAAVGDFNSDGKLDISAGSVYYAAPDWKMVSVLEKPQEFDPHNYSDSFCNFADDVNRRRPHRSDRGRFSRQADLVVRAAGEARHALEAPRRHAGDQQRKPQLLGRRRRRQARAAVGLRSRQVHRLRQAVGRGLVEAHAGFGHERAGHRSVFARHRRRRRQRRRPDRRPGDRRLVGSARPTRRKRPGCFIRSSSAKPARRCTCTISTATATTTSSRRALIKSASGGTNNLADGWQTHTIDKNISQTHSLSLVDINGDKLPDFVTGKRYWAHGPTGDVESRRAGRGLLVRAGPRKTASPSGRRTKSITTAASARSSKWPTSTATACSTWSRPTKRAPLLPPGAKVVECQGTKRLRQGGQSHFSPKAPKNWDSPRRFVPGLSQKGAYDRVPGPFTIGRAA